MSNDKIIIIDLSRDGSIISTFTKNLLVKRFLNLRDALPKNIKDPRINNITSLTLFKAPSTGKFYTHPDLKCPKSNIPSEISILTTQQSLLIKLQLQTSGAMNGLLMTLVPRI